MKGTVRIEKLERKTGNAGSDKIMLWYAGTGGKEKYCVERKAECDLECLNTKVVNRKGCWFLKKYPRAITVYFSGIPRSEEEGLQ